MNPKLTNVSVTSYGDPYTPPECRKLYLHGNVYGHPNFNDGDPITTSSIVEVYWELGWAQTRNTRYEIKSLDPIFVEFCKALKHKGGGNLGVPKGC